MKKKDTIIAGIVAFVIAMILAGLSIRTDKENAPLPDMEMKLSYETADIRFMQIRTVTEKDFFLEGVWQFAISKDETQLAVIPYTSEKCCVFNSSGEYLFSIFFNSNDESYTIYYEGNNLILFLGGDEQILIKFNQLGEVLSSLRLDRTLSGNHNDWLFYYKYNNEIQVQGNTYQKATNNQFLKVLGINSMILKKDPESKVIITMNKEEETKLIFLKVFDVFMRVLVLWLFVFCGIFMCTNPSVFIKYFSKKVKGNGVISGL